jgi:hypothetical protein
MVAFSRRELLNSALLGRSFNRLPPEYRAALRQVASREESIDDAKRHPLQGLERVSDCARGRRMQQLMDDGMRMYPAARQACIEEPGGASEDACARRLARKYLGGRFPRIS